MTKVGRAQVSSLERFSNMWYTASKIGTCKVHCRLGNMVFTISIFCYAALNGPPTDFTYFAPGPILQWGVCVGAIINQCILPPWHLPMFAMWRPVITPHHTTTIFLPILHCWIWLTLHIWVLGPIFNRNYNSRGTFGIFSVLIPWRGHWVHHCYCWFT